MNRCSNLAAFSRQNYGTHSTYFFYFSVDSQSKQGHNEKRPDEGTASFSTWPQVSYRHVTGETKPGRKPKAASNGIVFVFLWLPGWVFQSRLQRKEAEKQEDDASPCRRIHPFSFSHGSVSLHFLVQEGQLAKVESYDGRFMRPLVWRERASHEEKGRRTRGPSISLCSTV